MEIDWSQPESMHVYADWLESQLDHRCESWRMGIEVCSQFGTGTGIGRGSGIGIGIGIGRGIGIGIGIGIGSGTGTGIGIGTGTGTGTGTGIGRGSGIGIGFGFGRGRGSGIGSVIFNQLGVQMLIGNHYLVHCVDWVTIVGRCVEQVGPLTYRFELVSKIRETNNGDNWHDLAKGDESARRAAEYVHMETNCFIPLGVMAQEWVGDLPQEWDL